MNDEYTKARMADPTAPGVVVDSSTPLDEEAAKEQKKREDEAASVGQTKTKEEGAEVKTSEVKDVDSQGHTKNPTPEKANNPEK